MLTIKLSRVQLQGVIGLVAQIDPGKQKFRVFTFRCQHNGTAVKGNVRHIDPCRIADAGVQRRRYHIGVIVVRKRPGRVAPAVHISKDAFRIDLFGAERRAVLRKCLYVD